MNALILHRSADDIKLLLLPSDSYVPRNDDDPAIATLRSYAGSTTETTPDTSFMVKHFFTTTMARNVVWN